MTLFWVGAGLLSLATLALLVRRREALLAAGLGAASLVIAAFLYRGVGNPRLPEPGADERAARAGIRTLQAATRARPEDPAAWLALGQAYVRFEQYRLAEIALATANRLYQGRNAAALAGLAEAEALDGDEANDGQVAPLFESVLALEPGNPKALFYTGLKALHDGQLQLARDRFSAMIGPDVPEQVTATLRKQIAAIDAELAATRGKGAAQGTAAPAGDTEVKLAIDVAPAQRAKAEAMARAGAVLFVFARNPAGGPPLAVKRLPPRWPVSLALSAADAVMAGNAITPGQQVQLVARISAGGGPTASQGDLYGEASAKAGERRTISLAIDRAAN